MNKPTMFELERALVAMASMRTPTIYIQRLTDAGLLISRVGQHGVGIWQKSTTGFTFTLLGYSTPTHHAETVEAAVQLSQSIIRSN